MSAITMTTLRKALPVALAAPAIALTLSSCAWNETASVEEKPFTVQMAEIRSGDDVAQTIGVGIPESDEMVGELRWDAIEYRIIVVNNGDDELSGIESRIEPAEEIKSLYGGSDPFSDKSGGRTNYGEFPASFSISPGDEFEVIRKIITHGYESEFAENVEIPLTLEQSQELIAIAGQAKFVISWDGGSQTFEFAEIVKS